MASEQSSSANTQYNQIADVYTKLYPASGETSVDFPLAFIEAAQLHHALTDPTIDIRGKRVLDLACGGGYYTNKLLSWGAESIVGVDISNSMLETARENSKLRGIPETKLKFVLGDASDENLLIDGAPFDMVTACWLLNYAPDTASMTKMWTFIGRHLKPGGTFVGLTIQPMLSDKPEEAIMIDWALSPVGPWGRHGNGGKVLEKLPSGGYKVRIELSAPGAGPDDVAAFDNYYLRHQDFAESCRGSEMFAELEWQDFVVPTDVKKDRAVGYFNDLALLPPCRVCTARRQQE